MDTGNARWSSEKRRNRAVQRQSRTLARVIAFSGTRPVKKERKKLDSCVAAGSMNWAKTIASRVARGWPRGAENMDTNGKSMSIFKDIWVST